MHHLNYALVVISLVACGGSSGPPDPTVLSQPIAQNITITEIAVLQALKVPVMKDGNVADRGGMPLVALRDSVLRVYLQPGNGFTPHPLTAAARIVTTSPMGSLAQVFRTTAMVSGQSMESDLTTTLNIPIPGVALEMGASVSVVLNDKTGDAPDTASSYARWPSDGSLADLAVRDGGDHLKVMIVPVQYNADGSGRLPDTSDAQMELYRERFYQVYPTAEVDMTVHDPWPWSGAIDGSGNGVGPLLNALVKLRGTDAPDPDVYYYAAFAPTNDFGSYCGGSCLTGLSFIGEPVSVGIGYSGAATMDTVIHEVGHAHGRSHAPCGGAGGPDPNWPSTINPSNTAYANGAIGVWGYDSINKLMVDPGQNTDMMGYCAAKWISDYHYDLIFTRVRADNLYANDWMRGTEAQRFSFAEVAATGDVHVSTTAMREPWVVEGQPREARWAGGTATAYFFPYDHLPGGALYVPDSVPAHATVAHLRDMEPETYILR